MAKLIDITGKCISGEWGLDDNDGTGIPVLRTTNFTNDGIVNFSNVVTRQINKKNLSDKYLKQGDIIIEKSGGSDNQPVGRVIYFDGPKNTYLFNNFTGLLRVADQTTWLPKYVFYALFANYQNGGTKSFENKTTGLHNLKTDSYVQSVDIKELSYEDQKPIVTFLDKITHLIFLRKQQLSKLDELVKSRFIEMFDDKGYPKLKWNEVFNTTTGKLDSNAMVADGKYPFFTCAKEIFRIDKYAFDQEALLLAGNNAAGKYDVKYYKGKFNAYQRTYVLGLKQNWSYQLFRYQLEDKLDYLQQQSLGGLTKYLTIKILGELEFIVPPMDKQDEFTAFVEQTDKSKFEIQQSLEKLEILKKSLMQQYFG